MVAWLNALVLIASTALFTHFYVKSAKPATMERQRGADAYRRATWYRIAASIFELVATINYVVYSRHPLPGTGRLRFPWPRAVSMIMAVLIAIPSGYLMARGLKDAGEESIAPKREHAMYGGVYEKIRHPQAAGELPFWWVISLLLHSPFLALYSLVWIPIFVRICQAEEEDLVLRYGEAYERYRERTGAIFPRRRPPNQEMSGGIERD